MPSNESASNRQGLPALLPALPSEEQLSHFTPRALAELEEFLAFALVDAHREMLRQLKAELERAPAEGTTSADRLGIVDLEHIGALYLQHFEDALRSARAQARAARRVLR